MRQTFTETADPSQGAARVAKLRERLIALGVDGFIVPRADEHQGEYVAPSAERLAWISGFTGSAGMAIIMRDRAAVFVDGRYTIQIEQQVDTAVFTPVSLEKTPPWDWLGRTLTTGQTLAFDPWLHTPSEVRRLAAACKKAGATLKALSANPLDEVWADRPAPPLAAASPYADALAGRTSADKRAALGASLKDAGEDAAVLSVPESIAWLLNVRGGDLPHIPVSLCFAILHADGTVQWFIDERKCGDEVRAHIGGDVTVSAPDLMGETLDMLGRGGKTVRIDPDWVPEWIARRLKDAGATVREGEDPCLLPKACKTEAELQGARDAHLVDGVAVTRFLHWLSIEAPAGGLDEIAAVEKLEALREETGQLKDISFTSISGAGPNSALPHYTVTTASNRKIEPGTLYLIDSGGQYEMGTTDITRTIAVGTPTDEMCDRFTRVLKGMIALTCARFPEGTIGMQLDTLARHALWQAGVDYDHGTGHGVGAFLSVHEGPQSVSKKLKNVALKAGMIISNEPGFYKKGAFGIRIENLIAVMPADTLPGGDRPFHGFETLTLAPIDRTLIVKDLLSPYEIEWFNAYHARVRAEIGPKLDGDTRAWLKEVTRPI